MKSNNWFKRLFRLFIFLVGMLLSQSLLHAAPIVINEFLTSNQNNIVDGDGDRSDWIELYNPGSEACSLSGYALSDDSDEPKKWTFPDVTISPFGYLLVYASDKNSMRNEEIHTNFKLSKDGEFIGLYDPFGNPVDTITFGGQAEDVSMGRWPNGTGGFVSFPEPTPGSKNVQTVSSAIHPPGGIYPDPVSISMTGDLSGGEIRYTTDGSLPTPQSALYLDPLNLDQTTVINAAIFFEGQKVSETVSEIYFIHEDVHLPVLALIIDKADLWDEKKGIYANPLKTGDDWERPAKAVLIEDNEIKFSVPAGLRIHGQTTRNHPKKNFRLYFRSEYGMSRLEYPLFPDEKTDSFKRLVLHTNHISDPLAHSILDQLDGITSAFKPVALYLNGDYWGIYYIRERIDKYYVEDHFGFDDMDMIDTEWLDSALDIKEGDRLYWDETLAFFNKNHLTSDILYNTAITQYINRDNFTDYHMVNIFAGNQDWPQKNNIRLRDRQGDPRWMYVMWDAGSTWGSDATLPTLEWATRGGIRPDIRAEDNPGLLWSTLFLRRLLENETYKIFFINRFCDLLNTYLNYYELKSLLDKLTNSIADEADRDWARWYSTYYVNSPFMRNFDRFIQFYNEYCWHRPGEMRKQIASLFNLSGTCEITLQPPEGEGFVHLNTMDVESLPWSGIYFKNVPITLRAVPSAQWKFAEWNDPLLPKTDVITLSPARNTSIYPIFKPVIQLDTLYVSEVTDSSARIVCRADTTVFCNLVFWKGLVNPGDTLVSPVESHEHVFELTGLEHDETYHYFPEMVIPGFDTLRLHASSFHTKKEPLQWMAFQVDSTEYNRARFTWATSDSTTGSLFLYHDGQVIVTLSDTVLIPSHSLWVEDLADSTQYRAIIQAKNSLGEQIESDPLIFTTRLDRAAPVILDQKMIQITDSAAVLEWSTDEPVRGVVEFGLTRELGRQTEWRGDYLTSDQTSLHPLDKNTLYYYRFLVSDLRGNETFSSADTFRTTGETTGVNNPEALIPKTFSVSPFYPNPFNPETVVRFDLPKAQQVVLSIYNIHGQLVQTMDLGQITAGSHEYLWNADYHPAGTYIFQIIAGPWRTTRKCILLK